MEPISYWLCEHPAIVGFRWSHAYSWGSTWSFLIFSIFLYLSSTFVLHVLLTLAGRRRPVPLGPVPAVHSLAMALISGGIFLGLLLSSAAEIRDTRWFWRRSKTPLQWLLCFPLGTRPSGRVFFWSYAFYLSRFLQLLRTFFAVLRRRRLTFSRLFYPSALICMSFLWLEFSQSFQVVAILATTLAHAVLFGYRFWAGLGLPVNCCSFTLVLACQLALLACNLACHLAFLLLHFLNGGCNGIGAWLFNTLLNASLLMLFLHSFLHRAKGTRSLQEDCSVHNHQPPPPATKDQ